MNAIVPILVIVAALAVGVLTFLVIVVVGIHGDDRRMRCSDAPVTPVGIIARRVLGFHASPARIAHRNHADARR